MAGTKIIKQKIKAITSIKKITKTMEMVSFAKMKKSSEEMNKISSYIKESKNLVESIKSEIKSEFALFNNIKNKTNKEGVENKDLVIIFASNKGLCGSFNSNIYKKTKKLIEQNPNIKNAICFGKFADKIAKRLGLQIDLSIHDIEKTVSYTKLLKIEKQIRKQFLDLEYINIFASYTNFIKNGLYQNETVSIYPVKILEEKLQENESKEVKQLITFEPDTNILLETLVPKLITIILYSFILESRASEYSMRSFAMKRANESAGELLHTLKIKYNRVRQDSITQEIAEISAGANA